jgi:hypothetical protein
MISKDNEEAVHKLLEKFPEFKNSKFYGQTDETIPYLVFGDFCSYLKLLLKEGKIKVTDSIAQRIALFIVDLYQSSSKDLNDLVRVGIFEDLSNEPETEVLAEILPKDIAADFRSFFQPQDLS